MSIIRIYEDADWIGAYDYLIQEHKRALELNVSTDTKRMLFQQIGKVIHEVEKRAMEREIRLAAWRTVPLTLVRNQDERAPESRRST